MEKQGLNPFPEAAAVASIRNSLMPGSCVYPLLCTHYRIIHSTKGHDAFLAESDKINDAISPIFSRICGRVFGK